VLKSVRQVFRRKRPATTDPVTPGDAEPVAQSA
jgi:hypothetical protein